MARIEARLIMEFTKVPNFFFEYMGEMDKCEMSVVLIVIRKTIGFRKDWDEISLSQFMADTGMNKPSVYKGLKSALQRGIIERKSVKNSFEYRILDPKIGSFFEPICDDFGIENGSKNEPIIGSKNEPILENGSKNEPKSVQKMNQQYIKENINIITHEKRKSVSAKNEETETPEHQQWFSAVCWLVHGHKDYKLLGKTEKLAIATTVKAIRESNEHYTIDDLRTWYSGVWAKSWPGLQKNGAIQKPRLKDIKTGIGQVRTLNQPPPQALNGNHTGMSVFDRDFQGSEA